MTLSGNIILLCFIAAGSCLSIFALTMGIRYLYAAKRRKPLQEPQAFDNSIDVTIYAYDQEVNSLDDIKAKYIGVYRDTGVIKSLEDDSPICQESFPPTVDNDREFRLLVRSAAEVKRITDKTVIYFFKRLRPLKIKSESIRVIYNNISHKLDNNMPVVLRMTRFAEGDNDIYNTQTDNTAPLRRDAANE